MIRDKEKVGTRRTSSSKAMCLRSRMSTTRNRRSSKHLYEQHRVLSTSLKSAYATLFFSTTYTSTRMLLSKEYVGYLARQITQKLITSDFIGTKDANGVSEALNNALLEELQLEDRINDEVRLILEQYQDEMQRAGASYQEMFKKVKGELVRKYKAVL